MLWRPLHIPLTQESNSCLLPTSIPDAVAATTATVLVLFDGAAASPNVISLAAEVVRVTGRTERLVLREIPGERAVDVVTMAGTTSRVDPVVTRVIPVGIMLEDVGRPALR